MVVHDPYHASVAGVCMVWYSSTVRVKMSKGMLQGKRYLDMKKFKERIWCGGADFTCWCTRSS